MADRKNSEARIAVLCRKLGNMWSEIEVSNKEKMVSQEKIEECKLMVFGKLFTEPSVNLQAFFNTMKKAWRVEGVEMTRFDSGTFCFTFKNEMEKNRVLVHSPWSFSSHLLLLQPWIPNRPPHCYKFTSCAFWVQVHGLPVEWCTYEMVEFVTQMLGVVQEVRIESKGSASTKVGKARVVLPLDSPLSSGTMVNLGEERVWLDFKYERLPRFCYACGKMGHFTMACRTFPYEEPSLVEEKARKFGGWLRSEVRENSPFWKFFYGEDGGEYASWEEDEVIPETQPQNLPLIEWESSQQPELGGRMEATTQALEDLPPEKDRSAEKGKQHIQPEAEEPNLCEGWQVDEASRIHIGGSKAKKALKPNRVVKSPHSKKTKRYNPYISSLSASTDLDESNLQETPIGGCDDLTKWALVASPMKPPGYK